MMKPIVDFAKQAVSLTSDMKQCKIDIKELEQGQKEIRQELRDLAMVVQRLAYDIQRNADNERHEREKLLLRLELLLRPDRSLPPSPLPTESEHEAQIEALKRENEALKKRIEELGQQNNALNVSCLLGNCNIPGRQETLSRPKNYTCIL
jgi:chromosome segregation ATPase